MEEGTSAGTDGVSVAGDVEGFLVIVVETSGVHCPGFGVVETGFEPSEGGVLGGLAHSGCKYEGVYQLDM